MPVAQWRRYGPGCPAFLVDGPNASPIHACRRRYRVHFERADKLFKQLKAARLDISAEEELRKLISVDLLVIDDFALHPLDATETNDVYELVVERHRKGATVITSNRDPSEFLAQMADPLLAQSAVDRLQSAAYELVVEGRVLPEAAEAEDRCR